MAKTNTSKMAQGAGTAKVKKKSTALPWQAHMVCMVAWVLGGVVRPAVGCCECVV